jgi:hypothetical protein
MEYSEVPDYMYMSIVQESHQDHTLLELQGALDRDHLVPNIEAKRHSRLTLYSLILEIHIEYLVPALF